MKASGTRASSGGVGERCALVAAMLVIAVGCGSSEPTGAPPNTTSVTAGGMTSATTTGGTVTGTGGGTATACLPVADSGDWLLNAASVPNYSFDSHVTIDVMPIAPNSELRFDWSGLTQDLLQHPLEPTQDVAAVLVSVLKLTPDEFQAKVNANERLNSYSEGAMAYYPAGETQVGMYAFTSPGTEGDVPLLPTEIDHYLDPVVFEPERYMYAVLVQDQRNALRGIRMVQALRLDDNSLTTDVVIDNAATHLDWDTNLASLAPARVPANAANIVVDWSTMAVNALGNTWEERQVNEVMIGRYSISQAELAGRFLDLELLADVLYRGPVAAGSTLSLATVVDAQGQPFAGIDATATWVLALNCLSCTNPAPWFLAVLTPC